jgi:hypothetical protein
MSANWNWPQDNHDHSDRPVFAVQITTALCGFLAGRLS